MLPAQAQVMFEMAYTNAAGADRTVKTVVETQTLLEQVRTFPCCSHD
jgi:hypothetical protein